jgi:hypothetical protein
MPRVLLTILLIAILTACIKEETVKTVTQQDVSFGVDWVNPVGLKNDAWDFDCTVRRKRQSAYSNSCPD